MCHFQWIILVSGVYQLCTPGMLQCDFDEVSWHLQADFDCLLVEPWQMLERHDISQQSHLYIHAPRL